MDEYESNYRGPLMPISFDQINQSRMPCSSTSKKDILHSQETTKNNTHKEIKEKMKNFREIQISLERTSFPGKAVPKKFKQTTLLNSSSSKTDVGSDSDVSVETILVIDQDNDELSAVNNRMELIDVDSNSSLLNSSLSDGDDIISSEGSSEFNEGTIIGVKNIFTALEQSPLSSISSKTPYCDYQEAETFDNIDKGKRFQKCSNYNPFVLLERTEVKTQISYKASLRKMYKLSSPEPVVLLEIIPNSVYRKYGISVPEGHSAGTSVYDASKRAFSEDTSLYCVLGLKLLLRKRKQEYLIEKRLSDIRDYIIPMRNRNKIKLSFNRKMKRQRLVKMSFEASVSSENENNESETEVHSLLSE